MPVFRWIRCNSLKSPMPIQARYDNKRLYFFSFCAGFPAGRRETENGRPNPGVRKDCSWLYVNSWGRDKNKKHRKIQTLQTRFLLSVWFVSYGAWQLSDAPSLSPLSDTSFSPPTWGPFGRLSAFFFEAKMEPKFFGL